MTIDERQHRAEILLKECFERLAIETGFVWTPFISGPTDAVRRVTIQMTLESIPDWQPPKESGKGDQDGV